MALYLSELRNRYPNADIKHEYTEVAKLFEPSMPPEYYEIYDEYDEGGENNNSDQCSCQSTHCTQKDIFLYWSLDSCITPSIAILHAALIVFILFHIASPLDLKINKIYSHYYLIILHYI